MASCERCNDVEKEIRPVLDPGPALLWLCPECKDDLFVDGNVRRVVTTNAGKMLRIDYSDNYVWKELKDA